MSKIKMTNHKNTTVKAAFDRFLIAATARGVKEKTLCTYRSHFKAISKRLDVEIPIEKLNRIIKTGSIFASCFLYINFPKEKHIYKLLFCSNYRLL